jgi:uncharacterized protein (DUF427 family)
MSSSRLPPDLQAARDQWSWRGTSRPAFAVVPGPGQVSVWDFPRPPVIVADAREIVIHWGALEVARTRQAVRVLETAHPPSFYLPWADVAHHLLRQEPQSGSFCEWKGPAQYWTLVDGHQQLPRVAWRYPRPLAGAEALADRVAFYATHLDCQVDGLPVRPQAGGFYGGWITAELVGPFKGEPGSGGW